MKIEAEVGNQSTKLILPVEKMVPVKLDSFGEIPTPSPKPMAGWGWGQCWNNTGEVLLVYGPRDPNDTSGFDNSLYCLPPGYVTPDVWDCDGFYVPNDRIANQLFSRVGGPVAVKYYDSRFFEITRNGIDYNCGSNNGVFGPGQINWFIPNAPYGTVAWYCGGGA